MGNRKEGNEWGGIVFVHKRKLAPHLQNKRALRKLYCHALVDTK